MIFEKILSVKQVKLFLISVIMGVCATSTLQVYSRNVMEDISESVVRLHIVANSDSAKDQELKIKVRDDVTEYLEPLLYGVNDTAETEKIIKHNIDKIEEEAEKAVKKYGYTYGVTASFGNFDFPAKEYANAKFPGGKYDALRIVIGEGDGKNWWCVLYPQLCFSQDYKGVLSDESELKLKKALTDDEYDMITSENKINIKFKIVEWFSS